MMMTLLLQMIIHFKCLQLQEVQQPRQGQRQMGQMILQQQNYDLKNSLEIKVKTKVHNLSPFYTISKGLTDTQQDQNLALMVSIMTKEIQMETATGMPVIRNGIDLICVIDHSGSMSGEKIKLVRRTLKHMLEFLHENDRLCLIMFDCQCYRIQRLTRLMRVSKQNIEKFRIAISALQAQGGTHIENGMKMAFSVLKHRRYKNPITAIFLLSDGVDEGADDRVKDGLKTYNIRDPFTIKSFGYGRDCCPKLMNEIAHFKEGQFYFVPDLTNIDECFVEALGGLVSVVGNNVNLSVRPSGGSKLKMKKAFGDKWQYDQWNGLYYLYQPHLLSGIRKDFIFEIQIPNNQKGSNNLAVEVKIEVEPVEFKQGENKLVFQETVQISSAFEGNEQDQRIIKIYNREVMGNYFRVKGAECFNQALIHAENGNFQQSQAVMDDAMKQMQQNNQGDVYDQQIEMVKADLDTAQKYCYPGQFENEGRHHMTQFHIVHMYQKSRGVQIMQSRDGQMQEVDCVYQNNIQRAFKNKTRQMKQTDPNYKYS